MKLHLLPSTIDAGGRASVRQHLTCIIVDDLVAIDAGSIAQSIPDEFRRKVRDIVLTHAHLDHIAGLPLYVDDLFSTVTSPILVHAIAEVVDTLETHVFNWSIYPRFSELRNDFGTVMEYRPFETGCEFPIRHLTFRAIRVNHKVPSVGFIVSDGSTVLAMTGDTAQMNGFWEEVNRLERVSGVLVECAFPNELSELARISHHFTPEGLMAELTKLRHDCPIYVINIKPAYHDQVVQELKSLEIPNLRLFEPGSVLEI
jgi:cAMP phosphodiesterase